MKISFCLLAVFFTFHAAAQYFIPDASHYGIAFWQPDTLGNHRAVVHINQKQDAVRVFLSWRIHEKEPGNKEIILINASTGQQIINFYRGEINQEYAEIISQPQTSPGDHYIYDLAYHSSGGPYSNPSAQTFSPTQPIKVEKGKEWLLILNSKL